MGNISAYDTRNYAQFNPLSMQEIFAPAQMMREQHDKLAEDFATQEQIGGLSLLGLKEGVDDEAIKIHQNYMAETKKAADELATKGFVESGRRKNLYGLKQQYNQNVLPLENQLKIRQERAKMLYERQLADPTFRATMDPNSVSLTAGLKDPNAFNFDGVSGNQLYRSVAEKASQLSKVIEQKHPDLLKSGLAYQYFTAVQSGADLSQIDAAMKQQFNPADVDKMTSLLSGIVHSTFNEFGVPQKFANNPDIQQELWQTAAQGLYAAAGQKQFGTMTDQWGMSMAQRSLDQQPPPELPKLGVNYAPEITNTDEYNNLNITASHAKGLGLDVNLKKAKMVYDPIAETWRRDPQSVDIDPSREASSKAEILRIAKKNGMDHLFKTSSTGKMSKEDYNAAVDQVVRVEQERYKAASPVYTLATGDSNISKSIMQAIKSGAVTLPKSGRTELTAEKAAELEKAHGNPVITLSPTGKGVEIRYGDGNAYIADGSIFQNQAVANIVDRAQKFNAQMKQYILNPEKLKTLPKKNGEYQLDFGPYNGGVLSIHPSAIYSGQTFETISNLSERFTQEMLINAFGNVSAQNKGIIIGN